MARATSQRDLTTRGLVGRHPQLVSAHNMACQDLCKDILRAGQGGLISSVLRQSRHCNMDRPGSATPSSRVHLSTFGQSHTNVYTESMAANRWLFGSRGITLPDPPSSGGCGPPPAPPGKILSPMPTRCVCVCMSSSFVRVFTLTRHGGYCPYCAQIHAWKLCGWIDNIDFRAVEYLLWCYCHWTMFRVMFAENYESHTTSSRMCSLSVFQTE